MQEKPKNHATLTPTLMSTEIRNPVLLTGAGFTANFGGFLAKDMHSQIMNNQQVQKRSRIIHLLQKNFSFEAVYNGVMTGNYDANDKDALDNAIRTTYEDLDNEVNQYRYSTQLCSINAVGDLLARFASEDNARGYVFTLNQDLFVERWYQGKTAGYPRYAHV